MTFFLIVRLPSCPKSLKAIDFMQKNGFFFRISSNSQFLNLLISSEKVGERFAARLGIADEFKLGDEEKRLLQKFAAAEVKEEVDSEAKHQPKDNVDAAEVKEEVISDVDEFRATEEGNFNGTEVSTAQPQSHLASQVQPAVVPSTAVDQGVQEVQAEAIVEEARVEEPSFLGEEEDDEQRMESVDDREMTLDDLLEPTGAGDSMMSFDPFHDSNSYDFDASLDEDFLEQEAVQSTNSTEPVVKEKNDISESVSEMPTVADQTAESVEASADSTMSLKTIGQAEIEEVNDEEEEEEELIEEQECEDEEKDCDEEEDEDSTEDDEPEENASSDDDVREEIKKTKGRPSGSQGRLLFTCPCRNCPSSYKTFKKLEEHVKIHTGKQEFFCDVCKKSFSSKTAAKVHIQEREKKECCECGKKFPKARDLVRHLRCHTGEKPFECITCGQRFTRQSHVKSHMLTHTGEKRFSCGICKKRFVWEQSLKVHEWTHTGEKPYKCNYCDYRSVSTSHLRRHGRIHTGEKPFSCGHCEKRFTRRCTLKNHELIHTEEKPFECKGCGMRFTIRKNLKRHVLTHTGEKPFSCKGCDAMFTQSGSLKRHMKTKHLQQSAKNGLIVK